MNEQEMMEFFFEIHKGLPRQGPGNNESTKRAFCMLENVPEHPDILDVGCGPGMQTIELAKLSGGRIIAVDNHSPFLEELERKVTVLGLKDKVEVQPGDMFDLGFGEDSFDVIWSEGAIYIMGFENGLRTWKSFLKPGGYLAVSEATWLESDPPDELKRFWIEGYPAMQNIEANLHVIRNCGYRVEGHFTLPESAWWDGYYIPLQQRMALLRQQYSGESEKLKMLEEEQVEIDMFHRYSDYYGYVFYVCRSLD